jgi:integral membrane sensor domain MASE1
MLNKMAQPLFASPSIVPLAISQAGADEPSREKEYDSGPAWVCLGLGIAAVYALTGKVCVSLSAEVANVSWMLYIPAGLSLTASLLWGRRVWPAIFVGEFAMCLMTGQSLASSTIMSFGNSLDAALTGWWFHDRLGRRIEFDRVHEVVQLIAAQLLILQPLCTAIGMSALLVTGSLPIHMLASTAAAWYTANIYAGFIAAPVAIAWLRWPKPAATRSEYIELAALTAVTLIIGAVGPGRWAFRPIPLPVTLILVFPLLAWASHRFAPSVALTVGTALGLFAFDAALAGLGPFQGGTVESRMVALNVFMSVSIGTGLFLAAAAANERRFEAEQARLIAKLQSADAQVSRLEEFVTFCAWSGRVRWKDQWVSVETFLRERYNLSISHGISDEEMRRILVDAGVPFPERIAGLDPKATPGA